MTHLLVQHMQTHTVLLQLLLQGFYDLLQEDDDEADEEDEEALDPIRPVRFDAMQLHFQPCRLAGTATQEVPKKTGEKAKEAQNSGGSGQLFDHISSVRFLSNRTDFHFAGETVGQFD